MKVPVSVTTVDATLVAANGMLAAKGQKKAQSRAALVRAVSMR
jgi:hypothetical protein